MTTVQRFEPEPSHGRPRIAEFAGPEGAFSVHCNREDGSLWLFASGPRGGERGRAAWGQHRADEMLAWLDHDDRSPLFGGEGLIYWFARIEGGARVLQMDTQGARRGFGLHLDPAAVDEFKVCLREWAEAVKRHQQQDGSS